MYLAVLLIFMGMLWPTCEDLNNASHSELSTVSPHNMSTSNKTIMVRTDTNDTAVQLWPAANRTEIKVFRKGSLIISRQYWYASLVIALKQPQPISPAFTRSTTPTVSNTVLPSSRTTLTIPTITQTTSNTTRTTVSTQTSHPIIHTNTTNERSSTSAESQTNTPPSATNEQQQTITTNLTTTSSQATDASVVTDVQETTTQLDTHGEDITRSAVSSTHLPVESGDSYVKTLQTTERTFSLTSPASTTSEQSSSSFTREEPETTKLPSTVSPRTDVVKTSESPDKTIVSASEMKPLSVTQITGAAATSAIFTTAEETSTSTTRSTGRSAPPVTESGTGTATPGINELEITTSAHGSSSAKSKTTTGLPWLATVPEDTTLVPETSQVTMKPSKAKTESATDVSVKPVTVTQTVEEPTTIIRVTEETNTAESTNAPNTAPESETGTTSSGKQEPETIAIKTTSDQDSSSIKSSATENARTMTTNLPDKTESATQVSVKQLTVSQNLEESTTEIRVTQDEPETIATKTTLDQGSYSVLNSATTITRTRTTDQPWHATVPKDSTLVPETARVTMQPSSAKTDSETQVSVTPVTVTQTVEEPTTIIRPATQADVGSASTAHSRFEESNTAKSTNTPDTATKSETNTTTTKVNEPVTSATRTTAISVINFATEDTKSTTDLPRLATVREDSTLAAETSQVTMKPSKAKTESATDVSVKPVTVTQTVEEPTTINRVTEETNTAESTNVPNTATESETDTTTTGIQKTKTIAIKTTSSAIKDTRTTGLAKFATVPKDSTLVPETSRVTMKPSPAKTESATDVSVKPVTVTQTVEEPTTIIRVTEETNTAESTNAPDTATESETDTTTTRIQEPETTAIKTTSAQGSSSAIEDTRTTTKSLAELATVPEASTLVPETSRVTMESSPGKSTTIISNPVRAVHTGSVSVAHTTPEKSNTAESTNVPNTATESGTDTTTTTGIHEPETTAIKTTSDQDSLSAMKDTRTMTTTKLSTVPRDSQNILQTSQITMMPSPAKTESATVISMPVTAAHTLETNDIRVTQEPATQPDTSSALTTHVTYKESNTAESTNVPNTATESGTDTTTTTGIHEPETTAIRTTPGQGSSSVINSATEVTSATLPKALTLVPETSRVTIKPSPAKTKSVTQVSVGPVTVTQTVEEPTNDIRAATQAETHKDLRKATPTAPPVAPPTVFIPKSSSLPPQSLKPAKDTTTHTTTKAALPPTKKHEATAPKAPASTTATTLKNDVPTDPPTLNEGSMGLQFTLNATFDVLYKVRSTNAFLSLATKVVIVINKLYSAIYKEYKRSRVNSFSKGSVIVDMTLIFENAAVVPDTVDVEAVLYKAATIGDVPLNIIYDTIKAEATVNPANAATVQHTTAKQTTTAGQTNTTSAASAWIHRYSILTITAIITVFVNMT